MGGCGFDETSCGVSVTRMCKAVYGPCDGWMDVVNDEFVRGDVEYPISQIE